MKNDTNRFELRNNVDPNLRNNSTSQQKSIWKISSTLPFFARFHRPNVFGTEWSQRSTTRVNRNQILYPILGTTGTNKTNKITVRLNSPFGGRWDPWDKEQDEGVGLVLQHDPADPKALEREELLLLGGGVGGTAFNLGGRGGVLPHLVKLAVFIQLGNSLDVWRPGQTFCRLMKAVSSSSISDRTWSSSGAPNAGVTDKTTLESPDLGFQEPNIVFFSTSRVQLKLSWEDWKKASWASST